MGEVLVVTSGKGGTGKTTLCAGLASCLAAMGQRVLAIDCDIGLSNLDIALGMTDCATVSFLDVMMENQYLSDAPEHPVIRLAAQQDYDAFYEMEIAIRQLHGCPPFQDLFFLTFTGLYEDQVVQAAMRFRNRLRAQLQSQAFAGCPATLLGPAPCAVAKINYTYRYRLTLAAKNSKPLRLLLAQELCIFAKEKQNRGVNAYADVNSYD